MPDPPTGTRCWCAPGPRRWISAAAPGVARFELGVGGAFFTLAGTYM